MFLNCSYCSRKNKWDSSQTSRQMSNLLVRFDLPVGPVVISTLCLDWLHNYAYNR
jgi:hypothetical protein